MSEIRTPGQWLRTGTVVYTLTHAGWRRGEEQFKNRWSLNVQRDTQDCPQEEVEDVARLVQAAPDLLADLREATAALRRYEALHRAKGTPESKEKAEVNAALATRFEATIARATGERS